MPKSPKEDLLAAIPALRAFANCLVGDLARADDLVEETITTAGQGIASFIPGAPLRLRLFAVLRSLFYADDLRRARLGENIAQSLPIMPTRPRDMVGFREFRRALLQLPPEHREALIFIGASGLSYQEAATICDCAQGAIVSRVHRARVWLVELLGLDAAETTAPDFQRRPLLDSDPSSTSPMDP